MVRYLLSAFSIIILLQLTACQKKPDWKRPVNIGILMSLQAQGTGGPGDLTFTKGKIILSKVAIEGKVSNVDNFRFERNFPLGLAVDFNNSNALEALKFDLPQGEYSELKINFETLLTNKSIVVEGIFDYNNPTKPNAIIHFELDDALHFSLTVANAQGSNQFSITEAASNDIEVLLNPPYWFNNITSTMMNNASTTTIGNQTHIIINQSTNSTMYQDIEARIGGDAKSTLKG